MGNAMETMRSDSATEKNTIKSVFESVAKDLKIDKALIKRIHDFEREFVNRNDEHIGFFGGNLLGVDRPRFKSSDWNNWFDEIVGLDDVELRSKLISLPSVVPTAIVINDVMNNTCMWLVHKIYNSNLSSEDKHNGMIDTLLIFQYKIITSKIANDFKFAANKEVAMATYASLSKKYSLKQHGSWGKVLIARAEEIISPNSIHLKTIQRFDNDKKVQYMISDCQGRVKDLVKNQWNAINEVKANDAKIVSQGNTIAVDGEEVLRDLKRNLLTYRNYIQSIVHTPNDFIKSQVFDVVCASMVTMSPTLLDKTLNYVSDQIRKDKTGLIDRLLNEAMIHAFDVLHREKEGRVKNIDLATLVIKLRGVYMSSRSTDTTLLALREDADKVTALALKTKNASALAAVRTGLLLYIVTRAFAMNHYSS